MTRGIREGLWEKRSGKWDKEVSKLPEHRCVPVPESPSPDQTYSPDRK